MTEEIKRNYLEINSLENLKESKYSFDNLSTPTQSIPATLDFSIPNTSSFVDALNLTNNSSGVDFSSMTRAQLSDMFKVSIDGSSSVSIGLEAISDFAVSICVRRTTSQSEARNYFFVFR